MIGIEAAGSAGAAANSVAAPAGAAAGAPAAAPKNAQEAHEAIRPVSEDGKFRTPQETGLEGQSLTLYSLIYRRTLASVMKASAGQVKTFTIDATAAAAEGASGASGGLQLSPEGIALSVGPIVHASFKSSDSVTIFKVQFQFKIRCFLLG